jgi:hypothetical protein
VFTTQANLAYNGARVRAASAANLNNFMEGVASYVGTTLTMNCDLIGGSGTFADWLLSIAGQKGVAGTTGAIGPAGPAGGTFPDAPSDGVLYGRRNAAWAAASAALYLNVRDYGATGNGTTDDTAAINSALAAAGGRTVFFPKGYYIVSSVLTPAAGTRLLGENYQNTYLKTNQANGSIIDCVNGYITIESLGFNATVAQTGGIYVNARGSGCNLKNLFFVGGFVSIRVDNTAVLLSDITISSVASSGSAVGIDVWSGLANTWHNIQADCRNGYACFVLHNCGDVTATNCRFMSGSFAGAIAPASGQVVLFAKFIGCDFDQAGVYALYIAPAAGGIVQLVELTNIEVYGASIGVEIAGAGTVDCVVIDQMISIGCANFGVDVSAAGGATIRNVSVLNSLIAAQNSVNSSTAINYSGVNGGRISGNRIGATTQYFGNNSGVVVTGNSTDIIIDGNDLRSNTTSLTLGGSCDRISLANNDLTGAAVTWTTTGIDISWISNIGFSGWKTFTPNVVSGTGAITALGAVTGGYLLSGKTVFWNVSIGVTTVGSAGTDLRVSNMPFNAVRNTPGFGRNNSTGWMLQGYIAGTSSYLIIGKFDNGFPVADGSNIFLAGLYERT